MDITIVIILVLFCALLGATGQIFFKMASENFNFNIIDMLKNYKLLIGITLYAVSALLFVYSLKFGNLSVLYPIIATSYIWVAIMAHFFLNESFPPVKWLGIIIIIFGIFLVVK